MVEVESGSASVERDSDFRFRAMNGWFVEW